MNQQTLSAFIWSVADLLRGDYKQSDYGKVILPFTVLRRLDCVLAATKAAVLAEFDRINERGGVLGAMETGYQRGRIQDESMLYEHRKHDGSLPIIGIDGTLKNSRSRVSQRVRCLWRLQPTHATRASKIW